MDTANDPVLLLSKPQYNFVCIKVKPSPLNCPLKPLPCCYNFERDYKVFKWLPRDARYDKTEGKVGKRILKIKERTSQCQRYCLPSCCRGYDGFF